MSQSLILFDDGLGSLAPLCDLRASFELRSGALTTAERISWRVGTEVAGFVVPDDLSALVSGRYGLPVNELPTGDTFLFVSGRCLDPAAALPCPQGTVKVTVDGSVVVARLDRDRARRFVQTRGRADSIPGTAQPLESPLIDRPWHLLQRAPACLEEDLEHLAGRLRPLSAPPAHVSVVGRHPVLVGAEVTVHPQVVIDTEGGPVALDDRCEVRSMSVIVGPAYVGRDSVVCNHAHIRGHSILGPVCKVGGEVKGCVLQGFANKAHAGYLGDTLVGEWVNLGASTVTSNLKNTYGRIRMQLEAGAPAEDTGLRHLGSVIGDHVKTAIGTRLQTGSCLGTGAMVALSGFTPKYVDRFGFLTDAGEDRYDFEKFLQVAATVMSRRQCVVDEALRGRLAQLYDRQAMAEPVASGDPPRRVSRTPEGP